MGLLSIFWPKRRRSTNKHGEGCRLEARSTFRRARFETMEPRRMLDADPLFLGGVYIESDDGLDARADIFEVTFIGGGENTQMTDFTIETSPIVFFDNTFRFADDPTEFIRVNTDDTIGIDAADVTFDLADNRTLNVQVDGFDAGDKLVFEIDVDHQVGSVVDRIASSAEYRLSTLTANFVDPLFEVVPLEVPLSPAELVANDNDGDPTTNPLGDEYHVYFDSYDDNFDFAGLTGLLSADNNSDRHAGAIAEFALEVNPVEISGNVHLTNEDGDCVGPDDPTHRPLEGVKVYLISDQGVVLETTTDANGDYSFTSDDLPDGEFLLPGTYTIIEVTPEGLFDGEEFVGTVNGDSVGEEPDTLPSEVELADGGVILVSDVVEADELDRLDFITNIDLTHGDQGIRYDFCEHPPSSLSGHVFKDVNESGTRDGGDVLLEGVEILLFDENGDQVGESAFTDANGFYKFENLAAGVYTLVEIQPEDCFDGNDIAGTINGETVGTVDSEIDEIFEIELGPGQDGINYDFGEVSGSLAGNVHLSTPEGDCPGPGDPNHRPLEGVSIYLVSDTGQTFHTTTDANGDYKFINLRPGNYTLIEVTPEDLLDGEESIGTTNGFELGDPAFADDISVDGAFTEVTLDTGEVVRVANFENVDDPSQIDVITNIELRFEDRNGEDYDFCEHEPASLSGHVFKDANDNGVLEADEQFIEGVEMFLLDADGNQVGESTFTDANGFYKFDNLVAGTYTVSESQPANYFDGKDIVGTINDVTVGEVDRFPGADTVIIDDDVITQIDLKFGEDGINYDFGEVPPSALSGFVFHDANNNGIFESNENGIPGVEMEIRTTFIGTTDDVLLTEHHVVDPSLLDNDGRYVVFTDENGFYRFSGLRGGLIETSGLPLLANYAVYEIEQPPQFLDGIDTPGGTGGVADNSNHGPSPSTNPFTQSIISTHAVSGAREGDLLFLIPIGIGQESPQNNFGEISRPTIPPEPECTDCDPEDPPPPPVILTRPPPLQPLSPILPVPRPFLIDGAAGTGDYTWHLSVIDAGRPRGESDVVVDDDGVWFTASYLNHLNWRQTDLERGVWTLFTDEVMEGRGEVKVVGESVFGIVGGTPIVGDFNGDGHDEIGIFYKGEWFLDLNGDGRFDDTDLWAHLGSEQDRPVTGDWDGDGKDDIGIFGPVWPRDAIAIEHEPGLPDVQNIPRDTPKNVPPDVETATSGNRILRRTSEEDARADLIDHVFRYGVDEDTPIAGDWNGDGITSIGVFRNGKWHLDVDGDGRWSSADQIAHFGQSGDVPVVGDFDGNGVDEIGVYSHGKWFVDINGNRELDAHDKVFELGGASDIPVVGDWNGDGTDEPGLYREAGEDSGHQARR